MLHPTAGAAIFLIELAVGLVIFGTALFGAKEYSERAFRLLRWIAGRQEADAPQDGASHPSIMPGRRDEGHYMTAKAEIVPLSSSEDDTASRTSATITLPERPVREPENLKGHLNRF